MGFMSVLKQLVVLARRRRLAAIDYRRPGHVGAVTRVVEPYRLEEAVDGRPAHVVAWQVWPHPATVTAWRCFRLDRIHDVRDGQADFRARKPVTLENLDAAEFSVTGPATGVTGAVEAYAAFLEAAMLDSYVSAVELQEARNRGAGLKVEEMRAAHARVYATVLSEVLGDGVVTDEETGYLRKVRKFLEAVGWAP